MTCPLCGNKTATGLQECQRQFEALAEREFSDPRYFAFHRLTVDAYCLQHPERYMISTKSAATHLAAMCWSLEIGYSMHLPEPLKAFVDGPRTFVRIDPPPPMQRGGITIESMFETDAADAYGDAAMQWARSSWDAWSTGWRQAREWVTVACKRYSRS